MNRRACIGGIDVEDIALRHTLAEPPRVQGVLHLDHAALDVPPVPIEEGFDVEAVDRRAAVPAPVIADRPRPPEHGKRPQRMRRLAEALPRSLAIHR